MKKLFLLVSVFVLMFAFSGLSLAQEDMTKGEKEFYSKIEKEIPPDRIKTMADLHNVWQDVQAGTSKAILIDVRTQPEFEAGHIEGTNLVTLTHVYTMPRHFPDPNAEYWIFCRTVNRTIYFSWLLNKYGYKNVYAVKGGVVDWMKLGYP